MQHRGKLFVRRVCGQNQKCLKQVNVGNSTRMIRVEPQCTTGLWFIWAEGSQPVLVETVFTNYPGMIRSKSLQSVFASFTKVCINWRVPANLSAGVSQVRMITSFISGRILARLP